MRNLCIHNQRKSRFSKKNITIYVSFNIILTDMKKMSFQNINIHSLERNHEILYLAPYLHQFSSGKYIYTYNKVHFSWVLSLIFQLSQL